MLRPGLTGAAVLHLIDLARSSWQLKQLAAYVADKNTASARVLEKCGVAREQAHEALVKAGVARHTYAADHRSTA